MTYNLLCQMKALKLCSINALIKNDEKRRMIMKKFRKLLAMSLVMVMACMAFVSCGTKEGDGTSNADDGESGEDKKITLGVCQFVTHAALDASYEGFIDGLKEAGYEEGKNLEIDYNNANSEQATCQTIASKLTNMNVDFILAIATPASQACANTTKDIPIFITAVTDPAASGIVSSNEAPGGNVTGTSDLTPIKEQMELLVRLLPEAKKVAILYCSNEDNSQIQGEIAVREAQALGLETQLATVSSSSEIQSLIQSLVGKVDAIYAPTDNMIADNMATVSMIATANNIPIICAEEGMVNAGGLATYGLSYYNLGKQTAEMAVRVLKGEANTKDMPIEYIENLAFSYNKEIADSLGIVIPDDLLAEINQ